jgi:tetratricopeptide (TPR) repeat protein
MIFEPEEEERAATLDKAIELAASSGNVEKAIEAIKSSANGSDAMMNILLEISRNVEEDLEKIKTDKWTYEAVISQLVHELLECRDFEGAKELSTHLPNGVSRSMALSEMAKEFAKAGRFEEALNTLDELGRNDISAQCPLCVLAIRVGERGEPEEALDLARQITGESFRVLALERLVLYFLDRGFVDLMTKAIELIHEEGEELSLSACSDLAVLFARRGEFYQALKLMTKIGDEYLCMLTMDGIESELFKRAILKLIDETKQPSAKVVGAMGDD